MKIFGIWMIFAILAAQVYAEGDDHDHDHDHDHDEEPSGGGGCFSESTIVQVLHKGSVAMKDLELGDQILTDESYQSVYAFAHKAEDVYGSFIQLVTANGQQLEVTGEHLVFLHEKANPVRADSIAVGDVLRGASDDVPSEVTHVGSAVVKRGLYAPLTKAGTVVANGIVASQYIGLQEGTNAHPEFIQVKGGVTLPVSHHDFVHTVLAPFRIICSSIETSFCDANTPSGMPLYVDQGIRFARWADETLPLCIQMAFLMIVAFISGTFLVLEKMPAPVLGLAATSMYAMKKACRVSKTKTV